ncbi:MAG: O-antigen ligase family protein [Bacteroidota bacterium]
MNYIYTTILNMNIRSYFLKQVPIFVSAFLFCLTFFPLGSSICFYLLVLAWLVNGNIKQKGQHVLRQIAFALPILFYLLHVLSLFYSSNLHFAFFDLGEKISFLLMPLVLTSFTFTNRDIQRYKQFFIAGVTVTAAGCILAASYQYYLNGEFSTFFYVRLSRFLHPTYFTIYLNLSLLFLLENFFSRTYQTSRYHFLHYLIIPFTIIFMIMLASRTASIVALISVLIYLCLTLVTRKMNSREKIFSVLILIMISTFQFITLKIFNRFSAVTNVIESASETPTGNNNNVSTGPGVRIYLWRNALELIKENVMWGVGVGDVKDELMRVYAKNNYQNGIDNRLNPHNQYLQTMIALGLPGLFALLLLMVIPLWKSLRKRDWICFLFMMIISMNCMTESILERQSGIIFFTFFYVLLINFPTGRELSPGQKLININD